jgi:hypothetical protein
LHAVASIMLAAQVRLLGMGQDSYPFGRLS